MSKIERDSTRHVKILHRLRTTRSCDDCTLTEQRNLMIETIFTYWEYYNYRVLQKESLSILLNHFIQAYTVLGTLPSLLLTLGISLRTHFMHVMLVSLQGICGSRALFACWSHSGKGYRLRAMLICSYTVPMHNLFYDYDVAKFDNI